MVLRGGRAEGLFALVEVPIVQENSTGIGKKFPSWKVQKKDTAIVSINRPE